MFDSNFCLSASVNVRYELHTFLGLYKNLSLVSLDLSSSLHHHLFSCLSQSNHILQITSTHNNNDGKNNNAGNLPPTLEQVLVMQAQMLPTMQQTMVNMQQNQ
jgi:hypothetical protein